jgi:hypothetical protein
LLVARGPASFAESSQIREGFSIEGGSDLCVASGKGASAREAEDEARGAALRGLFEGLGKDRLFMEVFTASPPLSLSMRVVDSSREGSTYRALVRLEIDDESVRIVERGPYMAAAIGILDKTEAESDEADAMRASAASAEADALLGEALDRYGIAIDGCRSALELLDPVADPGIFSSKGKRTAPDLKKGLASILEQASAGVERIKTAEAALNEGESSAEALGVADAAIGSADAAQAFLDEIAPALGDASSSGEEKLLTLRDRIAMQRRTLADSKAALERAMSEQPKDEGAKGQTFASAKGSTFASAKGSTFASAKGSTFAKDKLDFARRRLDTADASLTAAYRRVDREIRDPAERRAERAQALRWALLHEPREYLSVRAYLPFMFSAGGQGIESSPFEGKAGLEGAFPFGDGGVWIRSQGELANTDLEPGELGGDELACTQSFDFGIWGKTLVFAGYTWDWLRRVDGESLPKFGAVELGLGGVYEHGASQERFRRADWLLSLSYELPYSMPDFTTWNVLNAGCDAQFRLGKIALLEASVSKRLDELSDADSLPRYVSVLRWSILLGLRLPPPFAFGLEYFGAYVQPLLSDGTLGSATDFEGGHFRLFVQYSI